MFVGCNKKIKSWNVFLNKLNEPTIIKYFSIIYFTWSHESFSSVVPDHDLLCIWLWISSVYLNNP